MPVIFELKPNARHAAKQRRGFLRFLGFAVNNKLQLMYSTVKTLAILAADLQLSLKLKTRLKTTTRQSCPVVRQAHQPSLSNRSLSLSKGNLPKRHSPFDRLRER
ncbi:MAG: hypothetical protein Q7T42_13030 [Methylotenera sp.]|uniref:hypothetical protein n=1 Tax=Methylotenera sp. TaxID=2051956 RepID=UPI00271B7D24|nr:hypothetical protein [Methylotenera sp.]MDO9394890.1 hypothetical protein [Methylotenera sp.]